MAQTIGTSSNFSEALAEEVRRLREALKRIAQMDDINGTATALDMRKIARDALEKSNA